MWFVKWKDVALSKNYWDWPKRRFQMWWWRLRVVCIICELLFENRFKLLIYLICNSSSFSTAKSFIFDIGNFSLLVFRKVAFANCWKRTAKKELHIRFLKYSLRIIRLRWQKRRVFYHLKRFARNFDQFFFILRPERPLRWKFLNHVRWVIKKKEDYLFKR